MTDSQDRPDTIGRMPARRSPTMRRRRLSAELRKLRAEAELTLDEVAKRIEFSAAKLRWIESAQWVRPNIGDVRGLLDIYGVTEANHQGGRREELLRLAREGRQRGWWQPYSKSISEEYGTYIGLESEAATLLTYQPLIVPGLLQTDAYARAVVEAEADEIDAKQIGQRVQLRAERQKILTGDDPLRLWAVIDEAALRRPVGGDEVMRDQMRRLVEVAKLPRVTLQLIPFEVGAHAGIGKGSFTILQFPEVEDRDAVYVDNFAGELYVEEASEVEAFHGAFRHLVGAALSPVDTLTMLTSEVTRT